MAYTLATSMAFCRCYIFTTNSSIAHGLCQREVGICIDYLILGF